MEVIYSPIKGLIEIVPDVFEDDRGFFYEAYHYKRFKEIGIKDNFLQENQSLSAKGVLRGIHLQHSPSSQSKLIRVIKGKVLDVAVDLRKNSPTFGQHHKVILDDRKHKLFYIPEGFGHGFVALEETILLYKCNDIYDKPKEGGVIWNDPELNIDWGIENPLVSEKDQVLPSFKDFTATL